MQNKLPSALPNLSPLWGEGRRGGSLRNSSRAFASAHTRRVVLKSLHVAVCAAVAASLVNGCARPWTAPFAASTIQDRAEPTASVRDDAPLQVDSVQPIATAAQQNASSDPTSAQLSGVLDQLQQIRSIDPSAES